MILKIKQWKKNEQAQFSLDNANLIRLLKCQRLVTLNCAYNADSYPEGSKIYFEKPHEDMIHIDITVVHHNIGVLFQDSVPANMIVFKDGQYSLLWSYVIKEPLGDI